MVKWQTYLEYAVSGGSEARYRKIGTGAYDSAELQRTVVAEILNINNNTSLCVGKSSNAGLRKVKNTYM